MMPPVRCTAHTSINRAGWVGVATRLLPPSPHVDGTIYQTVRLKMTGAAQRPKAYTEAWQVLGGAVEHGGRDVIGIKAPPNWVGVLNVRTCAWWERGRVRFHGSHEPRSGVLNSVRGAIAPRASHMRGGHIFLCRRVRVRVRRGRGALASVRTTHMRERRPHR